MSLKGFRPEQVESVDASLKCSNAPVTQLVECEAVNLKVAGSKPAGSATFVYFIIVL